MTKYRVQVDVDSRSQANRLAEFVHKALFDTKQVLVIPLEDECQELSCGKCNGTTASPASICIHCGAEL